MMFNKTMTVLSAIIIIGSASVAVAGEQNDPILRGTDVVEYQTHLQLVDQRAPMIATEFSGVRRGAGIIIPSEEAWFDRLTDSTQ